MGNLIPLVTAWIRDVLWNANLQMFLRSLATFLAIHSLALLLAVSKKVSQRSQTVAFVTLSTAFILIAQFSHEAFVAFWASNHTYALAAAILVPSLGAFWRGIKTDRLPLALAGGAGFVVAFWVNWALYAVAALQVGCLTALATIQLWQRLKGKWKTHFLTAWSFAPLRNAIRVLVILTFSFLLVLIATRFYTLAFPGSNRSFSQENYTGVSVSLIAAFSALYNLVSQTGGFFIVVEIAACVFVIAGRYRALGIRMPKAFVPLTHRQTEASLMTAAIGYWLLVSQTKYVQAGMLHYQYFLLSGAIIAFLTASFAYGAFRWLASFVPRNFVALCWRLMVMAVLPGALIVTIAESYQLPRSRCLFEGPQSLYRDIAHVAVAGGYAAVLGSYWDAWPVIFNSAVLKKQDAPDTEAIFPTIYRAELVTDQIRERIRNDLKRNGKVRLLCVVPSPDRPEHLDCSGLFKFARFWGTLPGLGDGPTPTSSHFPWNLQDLEISPPVFEPGQTLNFKTGGDSSPYEFAGWWPGESFGSWTVGPEAEVFFAVAALPNKEVMLKVQIPADIGKLVTPARLGTVEVLINDHHLSAWSFNPDVGDRTLRIPAHLLQVGAANFLTFRVYNPHSGRELGFSPSDVRPLGFAIASMQWIQQ
jgi:hypothetical protein